jgi:hypothetical protein
MHEGWKIKKIANFIQTPGKGFGMMMTYPNIYRPFSWGDGED